MLLYYMKTRLFLILYLCCASHAFSAITTNTSAFQLSATALSSQAVQLHWIIADNAYLYQRFIQVEPENPEKARVGSLSFPAGETKDTIIFGKVIIYHHALDITLPIENLSNEPFVTLVVSYQGCSGQGQCFPPETKTIQVAF